MHSFLPYGDFHRLLLPGTYQFTFLAQGYHTKEVTIIVKKDGRSEPINIQMRPLSR